MIQLRTFSALCRFNHLKNTKFLLKKNCTHTHFKTYSSNTNESNFRFKSLLGPASITSAGLFVAVGGCLYWYLQNEKATLAKAREERRAAENTSVGTPLIGGKFNLFDHNDNVFTEENLKGHFSIIYFGFTHCPDVCPDELDKMTEVVQALDSDSSLTKKAGFLQPIFITCDPQRDSTSVIRKYLEDFHPRFLGLTGPIEEIAKACKAYRVYFSRPPKVQDGQDYLVDHSIFFYLMNPEGRFVACFGKDKTASEAATAIRGHMQIYQPPVVEESK